MDFRPPLVIRIIFRGKKYFVAFVSEATRKVWIYPIHGKDEVLDEFKKILALVGNQIDKIKRVFTLTMVGTMCPRPFRYVDSKGIKRNLTSLMVHPKTSQCKKARKLDVYGYGRVITIEKRATLFGS